MGNDADNTGRSGSVGALSVREPAQALYTYEITETLAPVQAAIHNLLAAGIEQVALVIIRLQFDANDLIQPRHSTRYLLDNLRTLVRKTDQVFLRDQDMYFVLRGCNKQGGEIVQARLWEALLWRVHNMNEPDLPRPRAMLIGHSGYQETQATSDRSQLDACIDAASIWQLHYEWQLDRPRKASKQVRPEAMPATTANPDPLDEELPILARKLGIPYLSLLPRKPPSGLQHLVTPSLAHELHCFPVGRERDTLTVAMLDPRDHQALDRLRTETGMRIFPVLAHPQALQNALEQLV
jgi:hypothetical protein